MGNLSSSSCASAPESALAPASSKLTYPSSSSSELRTSPGRCSLPLKRQAKPKLASEEFPTLGGGDRQVTSALKSSTSSGGNGGDSRNGGTNENGTTTMNGIDIDGVGHVGIDGVGHVGHGGATGTNGAVLKAMKIS